MTKKELRQYIRALKKQYLAEEHPREVHIPKDFSPYGVILLYKALPDEVPTQTLIDKLVAQGKTVLLPRVVSDSEMEIRRYTGREDLEKSLYGIMEPTGELFTDYDTIDAAIIPGMAFDADGHRLGRGKGYYDRFLARVPSLYKIGLCFSWQMVEHVPYNEHDIVMDEIIQI